MKQEDLVGKTAGIVLFLIETVTISIVFLISVGCTAFGLAIIGRRNHYENCCYTWTKS